MKKAFISKPQQKQLNFFPKAKRGKSGIKIKKVN